MKHKVLLVSALAVAVCFLFVAPVSADTVQPGHDIWVTPDGTASHDFGGEPIPADFFGPGSDPFTDVVALNGSPLGNYKGKVTGSADTIVERLGPLDDGVAGQIELVALSLVSSAPITVTFNGGASTEEWDVAVSLDPDQPSLGSMTIVHPGGPGGTFISDLLVFPRFTFTPVGGGATAVLLGVPELGVAVESTGPTAWDHAPGAFFEIPGLTGPNFYPIEQHVHTGPHPQVDPVLPPPIPTVSEWGMVALVLLVLAAGTVVFRRLRQQVA